MLGAATQQIKDDPDMRVVSAEATGVLFMRFSDMQKPGGFFYDKRVRKAFNLAVNRQGIANGIYYGEALPCQNFTLFPWHPWYDPTWEIWPYDPVQAKALLAEAGYPFDRVLEVVAGKGGSSAFAPEVSEAVCGDLLKVGVKTKFQELEGGVYWGKFRDGAFKDMLPMHMTTMSFGPCRNYTHVVSSGPYVKAYYSNPWLDEQVLKLQTLLDEKEAKALALQLTQWLVYEEIQYMPVLWTNTVMGARKEIVEWKPWAGCPLPSAYETIKLK